MTPAMMAELRQRLVVLRDEVLQQLAEADHLDAGRIALLAHVGGALAAINAAQAEVEAPNTAAAVPGSS